MTTTEAAALLGLKPETVRRQCKRGRLPGAVIVMRDWDIPPAAVEAYRIGNRGRAGLASVAYTAPNPRARKGRKL